ncbi:hypothetical protein Peur_013564 [Populus x canadensis]
MNSKPTVESLVVSSSLEKFKNVKSGHILSLKLQEIKGIKGLSCVASAIGVTFHADFITISHKRLIAVCVKINAIKLLVKEYDLHCPNETCITISAVCEVAPTFLMVDIQRATGDAAEYLKFYKNFCSNLDGYHLETTR